MTCVLNGNRFVCIVLLPDGTFLPRVSYCAGRKCRIYHFGQNKAKQEIKYKNCWENGDYARNCKNDKRFKVCKHTGHDPSSEKCEQYEEDSENIVAIHVR